MTQFAADGFTGAAGTELSAYSSSWSKQRAADTNAVLTNTNAVRSLGEAWYLHSADPGGADYAVSCNSVVVTKAASTGTGLVARGVSGVNTSYYARWLTADDFVRLFKAVSGVHTQLASVSRSFSAGITYACRLEVEGSALRCYTAGESTPTASATDSSITAAGKAGIFFTSAGSSDTAGVHVDDFSADTLGAGGAASANGATIALSASLIAGAATGNAAAAGAVVSVASTITAGAATGAAAAASVLLASSASLIAGTATGAAAAPGQTLSTSTTLIAGTATGGGVGDAPGATLQTAVSLLPGAAAGAAAAGGQTLTRADSLLVGAATGAAAAGGQTLPLAASLLPGAATGGAAAAGQAIVVSNVFIPGLASAGGVGNAPGTTLQAAVSLLPGNTTGAAAVGGQTLTRTDILIAGGATGAAAAGGQALSLAASLLTGAVTGAAAAAGQAIVVSNVFIPGLASAGGVGNAPGATLQAAFSLLPGVATGGATAVGALLQAVFALLPGTAAGGGVPGDDVVAPGAELLAYLYLLAGEASGVVVDDYPMKYATLADMVTRYGQTELAQLTDAVNVPPSTIDTTRVQIAINDAQMEIDSAVGRIYRLPLAGCIRPPVPPGTEPTAVAPPQLTRLACDIARFFLYDDLAPESEVVRRYKQAKTTLEDIASGALQLACPWGGSPGELIGTDAQSGSAEVYDCFSPRQITDDTLRGF